MSVYLSNDDVVGDEDDVRIGNLTVSESLNENEIKSLTIPVTIPSDQPTGTFTYLAIVDATGVEIEVNKQNNTRFSALSVIVSVNSPDLAVVTDPFGPIKILRGGNYVVVGEVQNQSGGQLNQDFMFTAIPSLDDELGNAEDVSVGEALISGGCLAVRSSP